MFLPGAQLFKVITNLDGKEMKYNTDGSEKNLPVQQAIRLGLTASMEDDRAKGDDKFKNYQLASKIMGAKKDEDLELTAEEVSLIKEKVGKFWGAEVVGFVYNLLEAKYEKSSLTGTNLDK